MAETIENNLRKVIIEESPTNPIFFGKMSELLDELIKLRNEEAERYEEYLNKIVELTCKIKKPETSNDYPSSINTKAKRALFDNLERDENLSQDLDSAILKNKYENWEGHHQKEKSLKLQVVKPIMGRYNKLDQLEMIFEIIKQQKEYK